MASTSSSSSSSSTTTGSSTSTYDVFLSFRGKDTRSSFTSFLHRALKDRGINVFLDDESLRTGECIGPTLLAAIRGSKMSIPVFSEHYADSKWCLMELAQIVECMKSSGQLVLPIFFYVDPSNVRNQNEGSFAEAFQKHEKNFEPVKVKCWRDALKQIGSLKGEVVNKDTTDQAEIVESVVQRVLGELSSKTQLFESEGLIGIDSRVNDLLSLLDLGHGDVKFVGIWGIGGIGKSTIVKAVYNRIISKFNKHSFISDVREQAKSSTGLVSLQQRLLKDILRLDNIDISICDKGKQLIKERLGKEKVLIVLDDIDSVEQIDALAGGIDWFGEGSRVIITTRDEKNLNKAKVPSKIYKLQELNHDQSLQLFSLHAFSSEQPPNDYMLLSIDVANYAGGLPLTLEVFGSWLSERTSLEEWKDTIEYLKEVPPEEVRKRLRYSYDMLEGPHLKEMFLDAACFFIGWKKEEVTSIWEACGYRPSFAISRLIQRSLIKFEDQYDWWGHTGSILKMHDQIRDMGREIVVEENRMDPSKRSRLWSHDEMLQVLERKTETIMVKGMVLSFDLQDVYLDQLHFDMMPNLKFLKIDSSRVEQNIWGLPSMLRWFERKSCLWEFIRTNFYHKSLVHLELQCSKTKQAWNISPPYQNKRFQKLKVLNLSFSNSLFESPNFSWFPYLEQLDLSWCKSLESLDESIGQLSQLQNLNLDGCSRIMELPNSICNLKSLVFLNLSHTRIKELPNNLDCLSFDAVGIEEVPHSTVGLSENLEELCISNCSRLLELPRSMQRLRSLRTLDLERTNLSKLPDDFSMLSNLEVLRMSCNLKSFSIDLSHFKKLRILGLYSCELLEELLEVPSRVVELGLYDCNSLVRTLDISRLRHLKVLKLCGCKKLKEIPGLDEGVKFLDEIVVILCPCLTDREMNIHGQGTLLLPEMSELSTPCRLYADNKGLIFCIVFNFYYCGAPIQPWDEVYCSLSVEATIHQKDKATECKHLLRFEHIKFSRRRDPIWIHQFKGFDWFGIPLQEKDSIVIQRVEFSYEPFLAYAVVKFWKLLQGSEFHDLQKPIDECSSPLIVADFFSWDDELTEEEEEEVADFFSWDDGLTMDSEEEEHYSTTFL